MSTKVFLYKTQPGTWRGPWQHLTVMVPGCPWGDWDGVGNKILKPYTDDGWVVSGHIDGQEES